MPKQRKKTKPKNGLILNDRQQRFRDEYLIDGNATQAAIRAGYSAKTAHVQGHALLRNPKVAAAITEKRTKRSQRLEITADRVLRELARVGQSDIRDLMTWDQDDAEFLPSDQLTDDQAAAISSIKSKTTSWTDSNGVLKKEHTIELKLWSKVPALMEMGKHLGVSDQLNVTIDDLSVLTDRQLAQRAISEGKKQLALVK